MGHCLPAGGGRVGQTQEPQPGPASLQSRAAPRLQRTSQSVALRSRLVISVTAYESSRCLPGSAGAATTADLSAAARTQGPLSSN